MKDCVFCKIYETRSGIIFETYFFYSQFDKFPVNPGHAEIIPKRHMLSLLELSEKEWADLYNAVNGTFKKIENSDLKTVYQGFIKAPLNEQSKRLCSLALENPNMSKKPEGYNFGVNEGPVAGRTVHHLHFHVIPRFAGDVRFKTTGMRSIIPERADYE